LNVSQPILFQMYTHHHTLPSFPTRRSSDLQVPRAQTIATQQLIKEFEHEAATPHTWDHLSDAFEPVRGLVTGSDPLVPHDVYEQDRKSTRLNSSHLGISYAVFCLKKKSKRI